MNEKFLYFDGFGGISGDMSVAALLDLGADRKKLDKVLESLNLKGFRYNISKKDSYGISGCDFDVIIEDSHEHEEHRHEHGEDHNHGHDHHGEHHHEHGKHHHHSHDHHDHDEHHHEHVEHHHHEHRNLADVYKIIDDGKMSDSARELAKKIFKIVAEAESKAHGLPIEEIHFHEVGALDSIVDIVSAAVLFDDLGIRDCIIAGLNEGRGFVKCQHGMLPVPVPAVLNIAERYGITLRQGEIEGEMVTPTGIAIAAALRTRESLPKAYKIEKSGIGLGKRDFGRANFLRALVIREIE
jgi:uncharacterized protein (DUF111 family)